MEQNVFVENEKNPLTIEQALEKNGKCLFPIKGISMLPMLEQNKDTVVLSTLLGSPKKYDVVLIEEFIKNGVHGTFENNIKLTLEKKNTFLYILKRIFMPFRSMKKLYPSLEKFPFFIPFYWVHRFFAFTFDKKKRFFVKKEISTIFKFRKNK